MKILFATALASLLGITGAPIPYPTGYRLWAHVKSEIVEPQHPGSSTNGGIHHIYANTQALEGYRTGKFPDGSVLTAAASPKVMDAPGIGVPCGAARTWPLIAQLVGAGGAAGVAGGRGAVGAEPLPHPATIAQVRTIAARIARH